MHTIQLGETAIDIPASFDWRRASVSLCLLFFTKAHVLQHSTKRPGASWDD